MNGLIGVVLAIPVVRYLCHPFRRRAKQRNLLRVSALAAVHPFRPTRVVVRARHRDAFTQHPSAPVGSVWLLRVDEGGEGEPEVVCLQAECPHLGCAVEYVAERETFSCPCHASEFDRLGRRKFGPAPRDMDRLSCRVTEPDETGYRWVDVVYQTFRTAVPDKRPEV